MKRSILAVSCLVLGLVALAVWMYLRRAQRDGQGGVNGSSSHEKGVVDQHVFDLPGQVAFWGGDEFSPCYVDLDRKILYRWRGVVLRGGQVPAAYRSLPSRLALLDVKKFDFAIVPFEAPVKYLQSNGEYRPGFHDRSTNTFFEWKGITLRKGELLDKSQDGKDAILKPAFHGQAPPEVIEIDMPNYLKDQPKLWKKTLTLR
jgi:hypothetical protein